MPQGIKNGTVSERKTLNNTKTRNNYTFAKGDKPKQILKNWRFITLLNVIYKLASGCIAERIKIVLDKLISKEQKGFMSGRYVGENTRLLYDILQITDKLDIPGVLLIIDFEKTFDSISWKFIEKVLNSLNCGESITLPPIYLSLSNSR